MKSFLQSERLNIFSEFAFVGIFFVFALIALGFFPTTFNVYTNFLSDLGGHVKNPVGGIFFNLGCILGAVAFFIFVGSLVGWHYPQKWQKNTVYVSQLIGGVSALGMMMIGIITEDNYSVHITWAGFFFVCLSLFIVLLSILLIFTPPRFFRLISVFGFAVAIFGVYFDIGAHTQFMELIAVILSLAFFVLLGIGKLAVKLRESKNEED